MDELSLTDWQRAYENLKQIGIKTVKLLGGEPTIKPWLPELLRYSHHVGLKTAVLSNSLFADETLQDLVDGGMWGYFASVDGIEAIKTIDQDASKKSKNGYQMLRKLKEHGVPLLAANVVINKTNMWEIPEVVQRLSDEGFYSNRCTIQYTTNEEKEFCRTTLSDEYRFTEQDRPALQELAQTLIDLKRSGVKISIPESYLRDMPRYAVYSDWQCETPVQLRVDADGGLMLCNEYRTSLADTYNITTLTPERYAQFLQDWQTVKASLECDGCYWSCFLQAEENLQQGKLEFTYFSS
jgi:MoaA/NifB/PqqE/SkfB family radical SAM enzyme